MFYRKLCLLSLLLFCVESSANVIVIKLRSSGLEYANAMGGNAFVDKGDTVRFTWVSGTHNLQSTSLPSGVSSWSFTISSSNPTQDLVINSAGWHEFSMAIGSGRIICSDPNAPLRYYEFAMAGRPVSEHFVAATSDPRIQHIVDSFLVLPVLERLWHIKGLVARSNDGHNKNWSWHYQKSRWRLVPFSEEVCDGWPTYVETHLVDMVDLGGYFCPWSSYPLREVFPTNITSTESKEELLVYPNPAKDNLHIRTLNHDKVESVSIIDMVGKTTQIKLANDNTIDIAGLSTGMYIVVIQVKNRILKTLVCIDNR